MEVCYGRLNDPVAYGDSDEADETLLQRARENLTVVGLDDEDRDFEVITVTDAPDTKAVYLYTLLRGEGETEEDAEAELRHRVSNAAHDGNHTPALEIGGREYFSHIWDSRVVEGE